MITAVISDKHHGNENTHRVVSLVDAQQKHQLGEEQRRHQVSVDGVEVGADPAQDAE